MTYPPDIPDGGRLRAALPRTLGQTPGVVKQFAGQTLESHNSKMVTPKVPAVGLHHPVDCAPCGAY
jgi:hypothetical protein